MEPIRAAPSRVPDCSESVPCPGHETERKEGRYRIREASPTRYGTEYRGGFGRPRREPERPEPRAPRSGRGEGWPGASAKRETEGATKETALRRRNPKGRSTFELSQSFLRLQSKWICAAGRLF